jgi:hypothetical protein
LKNVVPHFTDGTFNDQDRVEIDYRFKAMDATNGKFDYDEFTITVVGTGEDEVDLCVPSLTSGLSI